MKKYISTIIGLLLSISLFAAEVDETTASSGYMAYMLENLILFVGAFVVLAGIGAIFYLNNMLMQAYKMRLLQEHGIEVMEKTELMQRESWWSRIYKKAIDIVPVEKEQEILFDHEYDGIRELDNSLPPWWIAMFYATIIIGIIYLGYYEFSSAGPSQAEEYVAEMEAADKAVKAYLATQADQVDETNVELLVDENEIALGQTVYDNLCAVCHGKLGEGGVGPNFADKYWLHGGDIKDLFKVIKYGVPEKGMISWKSQLRPADMQRVASYILTFQGTDPPNQKEPQGEIYEAGGEGVVKDSTEVIGMK